jgi:hypothetical protein
MIRQACANSAKLRDSIMIPLQAPLTELSSEKVKLYREFLRFGQFLMAGVAILDST